ISKTTGSSPRSRPRPASVPPGAARSRPLEAMWTRAIATKLGLVLLGTAFATGFFGVLEKRFSSGDFYPHYASFRSDPLGVSAFYESLEGLDGTTVSRNVTDLMAIRGLDGDTALLLIGYPRDRIEDLRAPNDSPVMRAVKEGARL